MAGRTWLRGALAVLGLMLVGGGVFLLVRSDEPETSPPRALDGSPTAATQSGGDPCAYEPIDADKYGGQELSNPPEQHSEDGSLNTTIITRFTKRSQVSLGGCRLHIRSYNGQLFGPTLRLSPDEDLNLRLRNRLPIQTAAEIKNQFNQENNQAFIVHKPNPYNVTNVHYHGLHVSPRGHSDNVFLAIEPHRTLNYHVDLPEDQPPGTYWYHAHAHGSTAIQVASGMAGALVVEDDPAEIPPALQAANEHEKVMLFQSILYDRNGEVDHIRAFFPPPSGEDPACAAGKPRCTWPSSNRRTTINGQIVPTIHMRPGEVQRWRMIDGTFRESLYLHLEGHDLNEIALDGNYLGRVDSWTEDQNVHLEPGYRSDVLVQASDEPGVYRLIDEQVDSSVALRGVCEPAHILAKVVVSGDPVEMELPTDAEMEPLYPFPHLRNIATRATDVQQVQFEIGQSPDKGDKRTFFRVNYAAFSPNHVRTVFLKHIDEWRIGTVFSPRSNAPPPPAPSPTPGPSPTPDPCAQPSLPPPHVFHIHVNPFQVERQDPDGNPEMVWKDTLIVQGPPVSVFTKYTDFTGTFVIHCHILDHEDMGMMEPVQVIKESDISPEHDHSTHAH